MGREAQDIQQEWETDRWAGTERPYDADDVARLSGSVQIEHTLARRGSEKLWGLLERDDKFVRALGASTGNQAVQQVQAGLEAIYLSGWQVAADANLAGQMYPDQSLYPANSVPDVVQGRGAGFSLEAPAGVRFMIRSRILTDDEHRDHRQDTKVQRSAQTGRLVEDGR